MHASVHASVHACACARACVHVCVHTRAHLMAHRLRAKCDGPRSCIILNDELGLVAIVGHLDVFMQSRLYVSLSIYVYACDEIFLFRVLFAGT